jgi:hypothetical protein
MGYMANRSQISWLGSLWWNLPYSGLSSRFGMGARIFLDLFQDLMALCFQ